jgi:hypothetical protein
VNRWKWLIAAAVCCLVFRTWPVYGCQYNVREVGFIDLGIEPYRVAVYLPENVPATEDAALKEAMEVALVETNLRFEPVTAGADANHPALEIAKTHGINRFPAAVLISPDGQSMPLDVSRASSPRSEGGTPSTQAPLAKAVPAALGAILDSPTRRQILEKCAEAYGVVLLIEGPQSKANASAREAVAGAIRYIGENLEYLPKPIKKPPEMVVLDQKSLAREQVLLWTFHLKPEDVNRPHAAVFYGRGRWLGPLFEGEILNTDNLAQLLSVIGGDCECGLDHRWLQGTMLPARWDEALQQKAVQSLGFDPENPMVKMEMVSIVRRGMGGFDYPGVPFEYQEIEVGGADVEDGEPGTPGKGPQSEAQAVKESPSPVPQAPAQAPSQVAPHAAIQVPPQTPPQAVPQAPSQAAPQSSRVVGQVLVGSLAGMVLIVGITSLVLVFRMRKP